MSGGMVVVFGAVPGVLGSASGGFGTELGVLVVEFGVTVVDPGSVGAALGALEVALGVFVLAPPVLLVALGELVCAPGVAVCGIGALLCALGVLPVLPARPAPALPDCATTQQPHSRTVAVSRMNLRFFMSCPTPDSDYRSDRFFVRWSRQARRCQLFKGNHNRGSAQWPPA